MGGDPSRQQAEEYAAPKKADATSDAGAHHKQKGAATPSGVADRIIEANAAAQPSNAPGVSGPPTLDFGERAVGSAETKPFLFFNNQDTTAYVRAAVEGSPAFKLISAPEMLAPSRDGFDPSSALKVMFSPTAKGHAQGTLVLQTRWANGAHAPQELRVPIIAASHEVGERPLAEEEAEQDARSQRQRERDEHDAQLKAAEKAADAQIDTGKLPGNPVSNKRLEAATTLAQIALQNLLSTRKDGVDTAEKEAALYKTRKPEFHESLLERLAWTALDIATGNIASKLGKRIEQVLTSTIKIEPHLSPSGEKVAASEQSPSKAVVAIFTDSVRDVTKRGAKAGVDAIKPKDAADSSADSTAGGSTQSQQTPDDRFSSNVPLFAFFQQQKTGLSGETTGRTIAVAQQAQYALEPLLDTQPHQAIAAMQQIASEIADAASSKESAGAQAQASAMQWIEYVAQSSLGTVAPGDAKHARMRTADDNAPTTRMDAMNVAPTDRGAPHTKDGLVNVEFTADVANATKPVTIKKLNVTGISNAVAGRLSMATLRESGLPIRAYGAPSSSNAVLGLSVTRDEAGNVQFTDETGAPGSPGNWFARKAGDPNGGPDAQARGARALMENDVLSHQLDKSLIKTDSEDDKVAQK